jgi:peptidoglycan L-alanyl-D-glutamate endopeptidase CwlK
MFTFGQQSKARLSSCRQEMQDIAFRALAWNVIDFACVEGHRGQEMQNLFFETGKSRVKFPNGKHNTTPSDAMDLVPVVNKKLSWNVNHCLVLAGVVLAAAASLGYRVRWGGNWDMDGEPVTDQDFQDLVHFEWVGRVAG